ncbi:MAG: hypothetical protein STHCBS139747_000065 [Sporothrix thermara]
MSAIESRPLGKNGPLLPRIGLGLMNNSGGYNAIPSDEERMAFLDKAFAIGERLWDTADIYQDSEDLLCKWFKANPEKRKDVFLSTKFGSKMSGLSMSLDSSPEYCRASLAKSLSRMGLDYIDLYYVHQIDGKTPIEKTMEPLVEFKKEGKIRHIGLSNCSADTLRRAHAVHPITAVQMEYSLFCAEIESPERRVLATARELGVAIVCFSPLGRGILSGSITKSADLESSGDMRRKFGLPWYQDGNLEKNLEIVAKIGEIAKAKGVTTPQLCLAWLLAQGDDIFPIPGTRSIERLQQNLDSLKVTVTDDEVKQLRELGKQVAGGPILEGLEATRFGDSPAL